MATPRSLCAQAARDRAEPLAATASRVDDWLLIEYRGAWDRDVLGKSRLPDAVKAYVQGRLDARPRSRLLFVRKPERAPHAGVAVFAGRTGRPFRRHVLESHDDLLRLDLEGGEPVERPLLAVCTHGKRDACCAKFGFGLYDELRGRADVDVWQSTHVGGDRFAGNLVCFPEGLYFGRVERADAHRVVDRYLAGAIELDRYRGRCAHPFPVQAAEHAVRADTGLTGIGDLELEGAERDGGRWLVRFRAGGETHEVEVAAEDAAGPAFLTCCAAEPRVARRYVATGRRVLAG